MKSLVLKLSAALMLVVASSAAAADFYLEVVKDSRIYVFDSAASYADWKATGDLGKATTRVGHGPAGESVVFMGDMAEGMYEGRHMGAAGAKTVAVEPAGKKDEAKSEHKFSWKTGKSTWESQNASLSLSNRVQFRYTYLDRDVGDSVGSFRMRRVKTKLEGWMYNKQLTYEMQLNWADTSNPLEDAKIEYDFSGRDAFAIAAGQYKVPFGRQELTSSGKQQFVDRTITSNEFAKGRDIGVMLRGDSAGKKVQWAAGIFNGAGRTVSANDNDKYQYSARLAFQPMGDLGLSESDFESKDNKPLVAFGIGLDSNDRHGATTSLDNDYMTVGIDGAFKHRGFSAVGEYFMRSNELEAGEDELNGKEYDSNGFYIQAGMFVVPKAVEIAVRYATVDLDTDINNAMKKEYGLVLNHFWHKHNLKLQGDLRWLEDEKKDTTDKEVRVQIQWIF